MSRENVRRLPLPLGSFYTTAAKRHTGSFPPQVLHIVSFADCRRHQNQRLPRFAVGRGGLLTADEHRAAVRNCDHRAGDGVLHRRRQFDRRLVGAPIGRATGTRRDSSISSVATILSPSTTRGVQRTVVPTDCRVTLRCTTRASMRVEACGTDTCSPFCTKPIWPSAVASCSRVWPVSSFALASFSINVNNSSGVLLSGNFDDGASTSTIVSDTSFSGLSIGGATGGVGDGIVGGVMCAGGVGCGTSNGSDWANELAAATSTISSDKQSWVNRMTRPSSSSNAGTANFDGRRRPSACINYDSPRCRVQLSESTARNRYGRCWWLGLAKRIALATIRAPQGLRRWPFSRPMAGRNWRGIVLMSFMRGVVILAFVLGLPAIAFYGVPDEVRLLIESPSMPWNTAKPDIHADHDHGHAHKHDSLEANSTTQPFTHDDSPPAPSFFARTASTHAVYNNQVDDTRNNVALASAETRVLHKPMYRPLETSDKLEVVRHLSTGDSAYSAPRDSRGDASLVMGIESRLRELGALNYQLQQQAEGGAFRFVCLCANEQGERRSFEATSADRLQAMQTVLDQVARWREERVFSFFISSGR